MNGQVEIISAIGVKACPYLVKSGTEIPELRITQGKIPGCRAIGYNRDIEDNVIKEGDHRGFQVCLPDYLENSPVRKPQECLIFIAHVPVRFNLFSFFHRSKAA